MDCLKCKGFMMVERHYTLMNRRLYARCLNCGFWIDLADLLRDGGPLARRSHLQDLAVSTAAAA